MSDLEARVRQIVAEQIGVNEDQLTAGARLTDDLGADSLDFVELTMALEEAFGVEIPDSEGEKMRTFGDVLLYVKQHAKSAA